MARKRKKPIQLDLFTKKPVKAEPKMVVQSMTLAEFKGRSIRMVIKDGEPWWVAIDVCDALGLDNSSRALARLDDDEKGVTNSDTPGGQQKVATVNEPGVYRLIFTSRKPEAEAFKRWLAHEVLPSIRKTGGYHVKTTRQVAYERKTKTTDPSTLKARLDVARGNLIVNRELASEGFKPCDFMDLHNVKYLETLGLKAPEVRKLLGLKSHETPLDRLDSVLLSQFNHVLEVARTIIGIKAQERGSLLSADEQRQILAGCFRDQREFNEKSLGPEFGFGVSHHPTRGPIIGVVRRLNKPAV